MRGPDDGGGVVIRRAENSPMTTSRAPTRWPIVPCPAEDGQDRRAMRPLAQRASPRTNMPKRNTITSGLIAPGRRRNDLPRQ
jgi:hypothetical protein